jgi:hypothetical protein
MDRKEGSRQIDDGWMDGWMDGWIDRQTAYVFIINYKIIIFCFTPQQISICQSNERI